MSNIVHGMLLPQLKHKKNIVFVHRCECYDIDSDTVETIKCIFADCIRLFFLSLIFSVQFDFIIILFVFFFSYKF